MEALQQGSVPAVLITGGKGHSTVHLYNSVRNHPIWHSIDVTEGRFEAEVLQDIFKALGAQPNQLLPLEVESLHCGGNASCSKKMVNELGLQLKRVVVVQVCCCGS